MTLNKIETIKNEIIRNSGLTYDQFQTHYARQFQESVNRILSKWQTLDRNKIEIDLGIWWPNPQEIDDKYNTDWRDR
jgi:hypothetical protein